MRPSLGTRGALAIVVGTTLVAGYAAAASAQTVKVKPLSSLTVFDANGKKVGRMHSGSLTAATIGLRISGRTVVLDVDGQGFYANPPSVYFTSSDCSGQAFILGTPNVYRLAPAVAVTGSPVDGSAILYIAREGAIPTLVTVGSTSSGGVCSPFSLSSVFVEADRLADLGTIFSPPFTVR